MRIERWLACCAPLICLLWATLVSAQSALPAPAEVQQRMALFKVAALQLELAQLAAAIDPLLHAELDKNASLSVVSQPALDLPSTQLALDCVGETPSCLTLVSERTQADVLVAPTIARTGDAMVLSVLRYDPKRAAPLQVLTRRFSTSVDDAVVLEAVPELVRELFGVSAPVLQPSAADSVAPKHELAVVPLPVQRPAEPERSPSLVLPIVLGAAGVVLIGAGIGLGVSALSGEDAYAQRRVTNLGEANAAYDSYESAQTRATLSTVAFGVGGAALAAGAVVFALGQLGAAKEHAGTRVAIGMGRLIVSTTWN